MIPWLESDESIAARGPAAAVIYVVQEVEAADTPKLHQNNNKSYFNKKFQRSN